MYLHVYFHKTTRSAELLMDKIFTRAFEMYQKDNTMDFPDDLSVILANKASDKMSESMVNSFVKLTDSIIWHYITVWERHQDPVLRDFCSRLLHRRFFKEVSLESDLMTWYDKVNNVCREHGYPRDDYFLIDEAKSSTYKDAYILSTSSEEKNDEVEASEQIFLFTKVGIGAELSNLSSIVAQVRNKPISVQRYYAPQEVKKLLLEGS